MRRRIVLAGGGHAHAWLLRSLAASPLADVAVTLVTPYPEHLYSGMLPGLVAGHYRKEEVCIDLARLARESGAVLLLDRAVGLDADRRVLALEKGELAYHWLSLNLGSAPDYRGVPGAAEHSLAVKPFERFLARWEAAQARARRIAVVGAGAAGIELAMAIRHRLPHAAVTIYSDQAMFSGKLAERIARALERSGVEPREGTAVEALAPGPAVLTCAGAERFDLVVWTGGAAAPGWLGDTGLALDRNGFVLVDATLASVSHPQVFAVGDTATLAGAEHPKSGVFAVRHGAVLEANIRAAASGAPLARYSPQARQLMLISCGRRYAIAAWGSLSAEGEWAWRWKDWIDRRWVARFG